MANTHGKGTPLYMAPEVWKNKPVKFQSDIYSLGLILHFMVTKSVPDYTKNIKTGIFDFDP